MQVSHVENSNTHAIMGGGQARAFGMSQSAEFFTVLSDTLYRDKKRAVIREVVCNAWDAHIMAGKTDRPVEITLSDEEMTIRDFGPGIADDRIVDIYCVYGNSTKVQDENQTGGFGLGSKAPFAYSDHFSVTSCHNGVKNIYAISRGGAETKGVPDMRVMVSVPTTETGLSVTIPVRSVADREEFELIIRSVAYQGGIKVKLNDRLLPRIDYTKARKTGYLVSQNLAGLHEARVYLLYGTVLYPVSSADNEVMSAVSKIDKMTPQGYHTVLIAPPNSVGVTPSREALSYTDKTIETIKALCAKMKRRVEARVAEGTNILLDAMVARMNDSTRFRLDDFMSGRNASFYSLPVIMEASDPLEVAKIVARDRFIQTHDTRNRAALIGRAAAKRWCSDRRLLRRAWLGGRKRYDWETPEKHFATAYERYHLRLGLRAAARAGALDALYLIGGYGSDGIRSMKIREAALKIEPEKIFVIAQSRVEALATIRKMLILRNNDDRVFFCASIPRNKPGLRASLAKEAENIGFAVEEVKAPLPRKPKTPKPAGKFLPLKDFDVKDLGFQGIPTLENPKYYVDLNTTIQSLRDTCWFYAFQHFVTSEFEDVVVVRGPAQVKRAKNAGAEDAIAVLMKRLQRKAKRREGMIAALINQKTMTKSTPGYWCDVLYRAGKIVESCPMTWFDFAPVRCANKQAVLDTAYLLERMENFFCHTEQQQDSSHDRAFFENLRVTARKTLSESLPSLEEFEHRWREIEMVNENKVNSHSDEAVLKILRAVKITTPMPMKGASQ
ncbi:hypothetical protein PXK56_18480 [Phaeobacter gallaeciensis]|uniref:hypothetical protein n=1 Tax=Phaeobacter gallaeciensis TaxID=60890 RepID=UPI0023808D9E|nr:hypothetical protein [Phaeobacter gallaeciensis]MDE4297175.1 hypothetical protein [Phaeobacter gallaeciensis]